MSSTIVRMYADEAKARQALKALRDERFAQDDVNLLLPSQAVAAAASDSLDSLVSALLGGGVGRTAAKAIADAVRGGQSMVVVRAAWGLAGAAARVLDANDPVADPLPQSSEPAVAWDGAAPLSSALRMPTLMRGTAMPLSNLFAIEDLAPSRPLIGGLVSHRFALFGEPALSRKASPLSSLFGLPTLTRGGKAFFGGLASNAFHLFGTPRLRRNAAPLSSMLGWPLLSRRRARVWEDAAPLSSALGLRTLVRPDELPRRGPPDNLAASKPIIGGLVSHRFSLFGEPGLSRRAAPLSSLFGLPTLTRAGKPFFGGLASHGFYLFGKPYLSRNPAPLSSLFGLGTLRRN